MAFTVLSETQLPQLLNQLEQMLPQSTKVYGELRNVLAGKWSGLVYMVDQWPDFKVLITKYDPSRSKCKYVSQWCGVFCQDKAALKTMLEQPTVLDWSNQILFEGVDISLVDILKEAGACFGSRVLSMYPSQMLQVTAHSLLLQPVPDHLTMKSLEPTAEMVDTIAANWPYSDPGVQEFITRLIDTFPSRCLVDKEDNLIGYALGEHWMMGMLFVNPQYRGRGYGKVIMSHLAKACIELGQNAVVCVVSENPVSVKMHEQIGFSVVSGISPMWMIMVPV